jgi:hypothetical protein
VRRFTRAAGQHLNYFAEIKIPTKCIPMNCENESTVALEKYLDPIGRKLPVAALASSLRSAHTMQLVPATAFQKPAGIESHLLLLEL